MIGKKDITGIILAGGKSSRMGSDKGLLKIDGLEFVEYIIHAMKPLVNSILIVSNHPEYKNFGHQRVEDIILDSGPVSGLYSGLKFSNTKYNLVLSCDVPFIKTEVLQKLINSIHFETDIVQLQSQNRTMPLIALYKKKCMNTCLELLNKGEKRLRMLVEECNTKTINLDPKYDQYVKNINTIEQLKEAKNEVDY